MNRIALWTIVTLLLIGGAWSLGRSAGGHPTEIAVDAPASHTPKRQAARPAGDFIIAKVNGEPIYHTDFVMAVNGLSQAARSMASKPSARRVILEELVKVKLLKQEAGRLGFDREPDTAVQISNALESMLAAYTLERLVTTTPTQLRAFYDTYTNQFRGTRLRQVLIAYDGGLMPPKGGGIAVSESDARLKAANVAKRIRGGEDFAAVAASESDDVQSAGSGGNLGLVRPGRFGSQLDKRIDELQENVVSDPIKSVYGFHIFEVLGREISSFEEVEGALRQQGEQLRAQIVVNDLRDRATVTIENQDFFEKVAP